MDFTYRRGADHKFSREVQLELNALEFSLIFIEMYISFIPTPSKVL